MTTRVRPSRPGRMIAASSRKRPRAAASSTSWPEATGAVDATTSADKTDLDHLSAMWRTALDQAETAVHATAAVLSTDALRGRAAALTSERTSAGLALEALARDRGIDGWFSDLQVPTASISRLLGLPPGVRACIFDSEGILDESAAVHAEAWGETFDELLRRRSERSGGRFAQFDPRGDYSELIEGKLRLEGVRAFLASRGIRLPEGGRRDLAGSETVNGLANRKREVLERLLREAHVKAFAGSRRYLRLARTAGLSIGVVSASASNGIILDRSGIAELVDESIDGNVMVNERLRSKPAPDVLLAACRHLEVDPARSAAFETTTAGVTAALAAGFAFVVAIAPPSAHGVLRRQGAEIAASSLQDLLDLRRTTAH
jgi:beta-phosphoglucomutase-like phosphatase (HAD superfamily)